MHAKATPLRLDVSEAAEKIVQALEQAATLLDTAGREADQLVRYLEQPSGPGFPRFDYPVMFEAQGLADFLSDESGSEFKVWMALRDARELQQLIELAQVGGG